MSSDSDRDAFWEVVRGSLENLDISVRNLSEGQEEVSENQKDISDKVRKLEKNQERISDNQYEIGQRVESLSGIKRREVLGAALGLGGLAWVYNSSRSHEVEDLGSFEDDSYELILREGSTIEELARVYRNSDEKDLRDIGNYLEDRFSGYDPSKAHSLGWDSERSSVEYGFGNSLEEVFDLDEPSYNRSLEILDQLQ